MTYFIGFLLVISLVVLVHEGGHFLFARLCGIKVDVFSLGFGRELCGYTSKKTGTRFKVCLIPMGGYVKMAGDADEASSRPTEETLSKMTPEERASCFYTQPVWKRFSVIFGGPFMNYVFAVLLLTVFGMLVGVAAIPPVAQEVVAGSPAEKAGIQPGDLFLTIDGQKVETFTDMQRMTMFVVEKPMKVLIDRAGKTVEIEVMPEPDENGRPKIGIKSGKIDAAAHITPLAPWPAFVKALEMTKQMTVDTLRYLWQVLGMKRSGQDMAGPIGIAQASGKAFEDGFFTFFLFIAQVSLAIGLLNLLPVPMLDGGHLALLILEGVRRKPLAERAEKVLSYFGVCILLSLFLYTFWNDIFRIIK